MNSDGYKIVDFEYCNTCKSRAVLPENDPCDECLTNPTNYASHRPVNYEEDPVLVAAEGRTNA